MESLPLKELDFGLQKRTGLSSGVVAFINLNIFFKNCEKSISHVQRIIFISAGSPFYTLNTGVMTFQVYIIIFIFLRLQSQ